MKSVGQNIIMVLDNCPAYPHVKLENVELAFLPLNTTSRTQLMDAGVFAISNYITVVYLLVDNYKLLKMVMKILNGAYLTVFWAVKSAWSLVTPTTIANCYRNAGFVHGDALSRLESSAHVESNPESEL